MAQAMSNIFGKIGGIQVCDTPQELWDMVQEAFENPHVDFVKITRTNVDVTLTDEGKKAEAAKEYGRKY